MNAHRLPLYDPKGRLVGYWFLRIHDGGYRLTYRHALHPHTAATYTTAEEAVDAFYSSYINYLHSIYQQLGLAIQNLPKHEYPKNGFRPGWLKQQRKDLELRYDRFFDIARTEIAKLVVELQIKGWPTPPIPSLPWERLDALRISVIASRATSGARLLAALRPIAGSDG